MKISKFYGGEGFYFLSEGFLVFQFYEKEAKPDQRSFKERTRRGIRGQKFVKFREK